MGNTQGRVDVPSPLRRIEAWQETTKTCIDGIVEGLREEEVQDIPSHQETSAVLHSGDDESSILSAFKRRISRSSLPSNHKEPLLVNFHYELLEDALQKSRKYKIPVLYVDYQTRDASGEMQNTSCRHALSHPLLAEAAEAFFITVAPPEIDEEVFVYAKILDGSGKDITDGKPLDLQSNAGMALAMARALKAYKKRVPIYLKMLIELEMGRIRVGRGGNIYQVEKQTEFVVKDASAAEVIFAELDGVLGTLVGRIEGQQVVQVKYNSSKLSVSRLVRFALQHNIVNVVFWRSCDYRIPAQVEINRVSSNAELTEFAGDIEEDKTVSKGALRQTLLRYVPLTALQATRANRLVAMGSCDFAADSKIPPQVEEMLSPRQTMILRRVTHSTRRESFVDVVDVPIRRAWQQLPDWVVAQLTGARFSKRGSW